MPASPGSDVAALNANLRFLEPVYAGDTLACESVVLGAKENSNGKSGVVYVHSRAFNQD